MKLFRTILTLIITILSITIYAENSNAKKIKKTASAGSYSKLNLNDLSTFIYNDGTMDLNTNESSGLIFPRGTGKAVTFQSGFIWGANVDNQIRVGGSAYESGLMPGKIISAGLAEDPNLPKNRVYRVRPDYKTADLSIEAGEENLSESDVRRQYEKDWNEWPAQDGAPYTDIDHDGMYNPGADIPGVKDAVQTLWYAANDLNSSKTTSFYGSEPMGVEMQVTVWAYNRDWALGRTYFKKYKLINKSTSVFNDMYVSFWTDADNGDPSDDFAGCDTTLSLGFCFNAIHADAVYGDNPPASGCDMVQGPVVPGTASDTAIFSGRKIAGKKNLPMTSFYYYINYANAYSDPEMGTDYQKGTMRVWNSLQGKLALTGEYFPVPEISGGGVTKFPLSGDPVSGKGYLDGIFIPAGDRRYGMASGPFRMAPQDTQEVVFAQMAALGASNVLSAGLLKTIDREIQKKYNDLFSFPPEPARPAAPVLKAYYTRDRIILNWDQDNNIEGFDKDGYKFQGYNLYQLPNGASGKAKALRLASFDIEDGIKSIYGQAVDTLTGNYIIQLQQSGTDSGIQRTLSVRRDSLNSSDLLIGRKYYFALSAYTYRNDPEGKLTNTESPLEIISIVFQDSLKSYKYMDTLKIKRVSGRGGNFVLPQVFDASKLTGHDYQIGFDASSYPSTWYLKDLTINNIISKGNSAGSKVIDGLQINVADLPVGMKNYIVTKGSLKWSASGANMYGYPLEGFNGAIGNGITGWSELTGNPSAVSPWRIPNTLIRFASTDTSGNILDPNDPDVSYAYRYMRACQNSAAKPEFDPFIKNKAKSYNFQDYTKSLPFAAYNYDTGERLMVGFLENNVAGGTVDGKYWPPRSTDPLANNSSTSGPREWFFIFDVPYSETPAASLQTTNIYFEPAPVLWYGMPTMAGNSAFSTDDEFLIVKNDIFSAEDVFTFKTDYLTNVEHKNIPAVFELKQNYPNPFNPATVISYSIPKLSHVELKVYDILGREVYTLVSKEQSAGEYKVQFNASCLSSGVYIYTLRAGEYSASRKLMVLK